jgi:hypothetical protein
MKPIEFDQARQDAMTALSVLRGNELIRLQVIDLLNCMEAAYQARTINCGDAELPKIRHGAEQIAKLRRALTEKEIKSVGLFLS